MTKVLVLDAGHGLHTSGKQTMNGSKGIVKEWTMNNSVLVKITDILKDYEVTIHRTDDPSGKTDTPLDVRVKRCNGYKADLFVSLHHNAGGGMGTEVYYHTYGTNEDKKVAGIIAPKLAEKLDCRNRGVKHARFTVLGCNATADLVEGLFMDTKADYDKMVQDKWQQRYAEAVAESIISYMGLKKKPTPVATTIKVNDKVTVKGTAKEYATGQAMASWVKGSTYNVLKVEKDKVLLDSIVSWVWTKDVNVVAPEFKEYQVEILVDTLNVREKADFDSKVVGVVYRGQVFTIVGEKNDLGELKSGAGHISLNPKYIKRK